MANINIFPNISTVGAEDNSFTAVTAADTAKLYWEPGTILFIRNGNNFTVTLTLITPGTLDGLAILNRSLVIPAAVGGTATFRFVGRITHNLYRASPGLPMSMATTGNIGLALLRSARYSG